MNIRNHSYLNKVEGRERMNKYWQEKVIENHIPKVDTKKRQEMNLMRKATVLNKNFNVMKRNMTMGPKP